MKTRVLPAIAWMVPTLSLLVGCGGSSEGTETLHCEDPQVLKVNLLTLVNDARARGGVCGEQTFAAAPPVSWNDQLVEAAAGHATDMAQNDFFSHTGSDGLTVTERVTATGYVWRAVGENLAAGIGTLDEVMAEWMASPEHCEQILNPEFVHMGAACAENPHSTFQVYWVQVVGAPES